MFLSIFEVTPYSFYASTTISLLSYCYEFSKNVVLSFLLISLRNKKRFQNSFKSFFDSHDVKFSYVACVYLVA